MKKYTILILIFFLQSCSFFLEDEPDGQEIMIVNNSDYKILCIEHSAKEGDTLLPNYEVFHTEEQKNWHRILPSDTIVYKGTYLDFLNHNKEDLEIKFFLIDEDVFDTTSWDILRKENMILKRYDLDKENLYAINWHIVYTE